MEGGAGTAGTDAQPSGEYRVADDVIASIAGIAATGVDGVAGLGGGLALGLGDVLAGRQSSKGVRVEIGTREAAVDVYLHVAYGVQIPVVAQRVQENVKRAVESMTGLQVVEVNVHVQGVDVGRGAVPASPSPKAAHAHPDAGGSAGMASRDPARGDPSGAGRGA